jgi:large subunit ribosomal protein L18
MSRRSTTRETRRRRRKKGIRKRVWGSGEKPRLSVRRSLNHTYVQVVDDVKGHTLAAADTRQQKVQKGGDVSAARQVGQAVAEKARSAGVRQVCFDRGGYAYHGRVRALADAAREAGLEF